MRSAAQSFCMQVNTPASRRHVTQDQLTREAVLQKELEEKEAKRKQKRKQKTKPAQPQADAGTEQEETDHAGTSTPAKH